MRGPGEDEGHDGWQDDDAEDCCTLHHSRKHDKQRNQSHQPASHTHSGDSQGRQHHADIWGSSKAGSLHTADGSRQRQQSSATSDVASRRYSSMLHDVTVAATGGYGQARLGEHGLVWAIAFLQKLLPHQDNFPPDDIVRIVSAMHQLLPAEATGEHKDHTESVEQHIGMDDVARSKHSEHQHAASERLNQQATVRMTPRLPPRLQQLQLQQQLARPQPLSTSQDSNTPKQTGLLLHLLGQLVMSLLNRMDHNLSPDQLTHMLWTASKVLPQTGYLTPSYSSTSAYTSTSASSVSPSSTPPPASGAYNGQNASSLVSSVGSQGATVKPISTLAQALLNTKGSAASKTPPLPAVLDLPNLQSAIMVHADALQCHHVLGMLLSMWRLDLKPGRRWVDELMSKCIYRCAVLVCQL